TNVAQSIKTALEWLQDCSRETAVTVDEGALESRVMDLFRAEDMDGIAKLMRHSKMGKEFLVDLDHFIARWMTRMQAEGEM
ncbi:MAG: hypothetical protein OWT28_01740, partial [Firmicutes bacterium]|nr:hypothetical protein [Bacillota bacterium]